MIKSDVAAGWGYNAQGQLGDGTTTSRSGFGDIRVGNDVVQVAAGTGHGLALRSDGTVWAWGFNGAGELGDGTRTNRSTPVQVTGLTRVTQVAGSGYFSLALRSDGTVWAWGDNRRGQLGNGSMASSPVPVTVAGLSQVTRISAGYDSSMATRTSGISAITSVWTWGGNDFGQLGDGTLTSHSTPERVTGLPLYIAGISAGGGFTARLGDGGISATGGFATVLGTDGTVWAWGDDSAGQLGNARSSTPVTRPVNTIGTGSGITQLSAGDLHLLALKSNGTVLAWGSNGSGQLGNGTTTDPPRRGAGHRPYQRHAGGRRRTIQPCGPHHTGAPGVIAARRWPGCLTAVVPVCSPGSPVFRWLSRKGRRCGGWRTSALFRRRYSTAGAGIRRGARPGRRAST